MNNELSNKKPKLTEIESTVKSFLFDCESEKIHVIKTGFNDLYMVVYEDAHEVSLGKVEFGTKKEIENKFDIAL